MWARIAEIILTFISTFLSQIIDNKEKLKKVEQLGSEKEKLENLDVTSEKHEAAEVELQKPILQGNDLIEDLRRKNNAPGSGNTSIR